MNTMKKYIWRLGIGLFLIGLSAITSAENWSVTEIHYQYGTGFKASSAEFHPDGPETTAHIITFQHAGGWDYGANFFFIDVIDKKEGTGDTSGGCLFTPAGGCSGVEIYGEWYPTLSLGKMLGSDLSFGPVKDVSLLFGLNFGGDINTLSTIWGLEFPLNIPGFAFANLDVGLFKGNEEGADLGNAFYIDFNWLYPFSLGNQDFTIEGHIEYIGPQGGNFFTKEGWVLAQPQIRWDMGKAVFGKPKKLYAGLEYQYWKNKAGRDGITDSFPQALVVWQF